MRLAEELMGRYMTREGMEWLSNELGITIYDNS